ncbi:pyridoxamine 5'-phosphate oxidase family protein [Thiobacillus sp.]|uniref:pyridoxamine 5'-phosphate oxidase family protein n=1 Tax=Thiobacillus sp. TaxID=924 RepID=UPI00286E80DC|nr:pyridoxamine 5'-phosphate oxidase family protein [Thiobacillus sp.]
MIPDFSGNKLYNSLGNILVNPHIGMLFVAFRTAEQLVGLPRVQQASRAYELPNEAVHVRQ